MKSWKQKKVRAERQKARRELRRMIGKTTSHSGYRGVDKYPELKYKGDIVLTKKKLSFRQRMANALQKLSFRKIFKRGDNR